jgi:hypothetical protein
VDEPSDLERSRLLLGWLQARRAVDHCLSDLLAAGPAGERRVREQLALVDDLESRAQEAFDRYRTAAETATTAPGTWSVGIDRPRLNIVRTPDRAVSADRIASQPEPSRARSNADRKGGHHRNR